MNLQQAIPGAGSDERSRSLLDDFERMGIPSTSPIEDVIRRIADPETPWNVRSALLMTAAAAKLTSVADSLPTLLKTLLEREHGFEELQVLESAWWMYADFARRYRLDDLIELANRSLEMAARHDARNIENILSAVAETVAECASDESSTALPNDVRQWLSGLKREWLLFLRSKSVLTPDGERFYRLATGRDVKASRRLLSDWLMKNVEPANPHDPVPAARTPKG